MNSQYLEEKKLSTLCDKLKNLFSNLDPNNRCLRLAVLIDEITSKEMKKGLIKVL